MDAAARLGRVVSRQLSLGSRRLSGKFIRKQSSLGPKSGANPTRFALGRQSSLDPNRRSPVRDELTVPENLDTTMQLLFMACTGDVSGVENLLNEGVDVNSIDLDGRTALHIAACEGHVEVVKLLLDRKANIDSRDRWGSTAAGDAKFYKHNEVFNLLKAQGAKVPKTQRTPMVVSNPQEIPEYEINPTELQRPKGERAAMGAYQIAKWNGTKVAIKKLDEESYSNMESINAFRHELTLLEKVRHPNLLQFVGAVTQNKPMLIVSEYHTGGNLQDYLLKKGRLKARRALKFALDVAMGMNYLHECKPDPIIHLELMPKNIFLSSGGQLKVAGFGLIRTEKVSHDKFKLAQSYARVDRSSLYVAPEVYKNEMFDRSVDVFSFGLILYEMIEGVPAFHPSAPEDATKMICLEELRPPFSSKSKSCPPSVKELIQECWHQNCACRPTFSEIITRVDKIYANSVKQGWWKENFKLPWK